MIKVVIVDDEALVRSGFEMILEVAEDIAVVGSADGAEAVQLVQATRPHVLLVDIRMPQRSGLDVIRDVQRLDAPPAVAVLTTFDTDDHISQALRMGVAGFLVKDTDPDELPSIVRSLASGATVLSPQVSRHIIAAYLEGGRQSSPRLQELTAREQEVLVRLAEGGSNADIAASLFLSAATVKDHVSAILTKLDVSTRLQAALIAERAGLTRASGETR